MNSGGNRRWLCYTATSFVFLLASIVFVVRFFLYVPQRWKRIPPTRTTVGAEEYLTSRPAAIVTYLLNVDDLAQALRIFTITCGSQSRSKPVPIDPTYPYPRYPKENYAVPMFPLPLEDDPGPTRDIQHRLRLKNTLCCISRSPKAMEL